MDPNKNEILLDTNTFGKFLTQEVDFEKIKAWRLYCTTAQRIEIDNTCDKEKREKLQGIFRLLNSQTINNPVTPYGLGVYGVSRYADLDKIDEFHRLKEEIKRLDIDAELKGKKRIKHFTPDQRELNWAADAMVIQGAMKLGKSCFVITDDESLQTLATNNKVRTAKLKTFLEDVMKPRNVSS